MTLKFLPNETALPPVTLTAGSPGALHAKLREDQPGRHGGLLHVLTGDPQILTNSFTISGIDEPELARRLAIEAGDLLSLPIAEVEIDFLILSRKDKALHGLFVCAPRALVQDYLDAFRGTPWTPLGLSPQIAEESLQFLKSAAGTNERTAAVVLNGSGLAGLVLARDGRCELVRQIPYENTADVRHELVRSLLSICGKSDKKECHHIHYQGPEGEAHLFRDLAGQFGPACSFTAALAPGQAPGTIKDPLGPALNLFRNDTVPLPRLRTVTAALHGTVLLAGLLLILQTGSLINQSLRMHQMRASYSAEDVAEAKTMKTQLRQIP